MIPQGWPFRIVTRETLPGREHNLGRGERAEGNSWDATYPWPSASHTSSPGRRSGQCTKASPTGGNVQN